MIPKKIYDNVHDDIDILVRDDQAHLIPRKKFCTDNDIRVIKDNYFPQEKAIEMLESGTYYNKIVRVPNRKMYFLSMAYHILYHKIKIPHWGKLYIPS